MRPKGLTQRRPRRPRPWICCSAKTTAPCPIAPLRSPSSQVLIRRMPDDAQATARQLFAVLLSFDDAGVRLIWVEPPPDTPAWEGVRDRLQRAAAA